MEINQRNIKLLSTIGPRAAFGLYALDLVKEHDDLMILSCDVSTSAGLDRFRKQHSENYLELGISEQNIIGTAAGLSILGFKPYIYSINSFIIYNPFFLLQVIQLIYCIILPY